MCVCERERERERERGKERGRGVREGGRENEYQIHIDRQRSKKRW